ncbi:helix-turn-helix transcriptional regulator [Flavobacterium zhairuonense]|uniref:helix-turn-helix domain-containing protein n=1 Tax=Flavobacterium zhairuonense TaxID=2493631 RepID=UPI001046690B|nr:helix-turn-helix transcriptional regulator [Flavobacterium zhairuonense]KAF2507778.1 helix-turn-helix transcriptional regulator [Flavobacterium zhairuonense]
MPVGFKIKKLREENNLSQSKLADDLGITQSELSKIENGRLKKIDLYFVVKVCNYFSKNLDFFVAGEMTQKKQGEFNIENSTLVILNELNKIVQEFREKNEYKNKKSCS